MSAWRCSLAIVILTVLREPRSRLYVRSSGADGQ